MIPAGKMRDRQAIGADMSESGRGEVLRIGVGGPVGSGKTALVDCLCKQLRDRLNIAVVTNDIRTSQ